MALFEPGSELQEEAKFSILAESWQADGGKAWGKRDVILLRSVMLPLLASHHRLPYSIDICVFFFPTMQKMMLLKTEAMSSSALHLQVPPIAFYVSWTYSQMRE